MEIRIPDYAAEILEQLEERGYEAWAVGGAVRDSLMGRTAQDWDITTSARPEEVVLCFPDRKLLETGLRHGTLTVLTQGGPVEVTTYREDGAYTDHRRPDSVRFTRALSADLSRRDFTVNAMAWSPKRGLVDLFGGQEDLEKGLIRCVGEPERRFREDALRILRCLRFASQLDFRIQDETAGAMERCRDLLSAVAAERIRVELDKALCGPGVRRAFTEHPAVLTAVLPELAPMIGFDQKNHHHYLDVWQHTLQAVSHTRAEPMLRLTMLLHDVGKPASFSLDEKGVGHFYGHPKRGMQMAEGILDRLRYDRDTRERVLRLIRWHDVDLKPEDRLVKRWLRRLGEEDFRNLLEVKRADVMGQAPHYQLENSRLLARLWETLDRVLAEGQCFTLASLAVRGHDLMAIGIPAGKELGLLLDHLLEEVVEDRLPNEKEALLEEARRYGGDL